MSSDAATAKRKLPVVPLLILGIGAGAGGLLLLRGVDIRALLDQSLAAIRSLGPVVFFAAMTVLPAFGMPMLAFTMTAGEAFGPQLGVPGVILASITAIALNLALGYWVARYALRPVLARLITRYGYKVPRVTPKNALTVTLLVRLTPGPPYALQACLLGLAEVPFRTYLLVSWLAMLPWALGGIFLGKGLFSGRFGVLATGIGVLIVAMILVQIIRRKYIRAKAPDEVEG